MLGNAYVPTRVQIDADVLGWLEPVSKDISDAELRRRFERDGVVLVKGVIPRESVLAMRKNYFEHVSSSGVLLKGTDPTDGIFCGGDPHMFGRSP